MTVAPGRHKVLADVAELNGCRGGKPVVLAHGCFDVLHPGHIGYLREAKAKGDVLVVSVTADEYVNKGPGKPVFSQWQRMEQLAALDMVDYVVPSNAPTAAEVIEAVRPDLFVKGGDYDEQGIIQEEKDALASVGGRLAFTPYFPVPKEDLNGTFHSYSEETWRWLEGFRRRHSADEILGSVDSIANLSILVVGESITDRYVIVNMLTKSPREHHLSVKKLRTEAYHGGSVAIQNHLAGFAKNVRLVCQREPIVKERFVEEQEFRKLFSIQTLPDTLSIKLEGLDLLAHAAEYSMVIAMDYGHGLFTPELRDGLQKQARFLAVNCQTNSANYGLNLATKWKRLDFICMDGPEQRLALANGWDIYSASNVLLTNGSKGCNFGMDVPSFVTQLVDRVGAGDALFSLAAPLTCLGVDREVAAFVGSCAAAMQCATFGNEKPIDPKVLRKFIRRLV